MSGVSNEAILYAEHDFQKSQHFYQKGEKKVRPSLSKSQKALHAQGVKASL